MSKQAGESLSEQLKQLPMQKQILSTTTAPTANKDAVSPILFGLASRGLELRSFFVSGKS